MRQEGINPNQGDIYNVTALYLACQNGHLEIVRELLKRKDIDVNRADTDNVTALYLACQNGHLEIVRELLKRKDIDVNRADTDNVTAFYAACEYGRFDIVCELLKREETNTNQPKNNGVTPFYTACQYGYTSIVSLLIDSKRIDSIDRIGLENHTPLLVACLSPHTHGKKELFELLLKNGASLTHKNDKNETALDIAVRQKNTAAIEAITEWKKKLELKPEEHANVITESRKGITQEELQSAVLKALSNYTEYLRPGVNSVQGAGFFSPSAKDFAIANEFNNSIKPEQNLSLTDTVVTLKNFLGDPSRGYDHHSFATYLAEALADLALVTAKSAGRYDQKQVVKELEQWISAHPEMQEVKLQNN